MIPSTVHQTCCKNTLTTENKQQNTANSSIYNFEVYAINCAIHQQFFTPLKAKPTAAMQTTVILSPSKPETGMHVDHSGTQSGEGKVCSSY